MSIGKEKRSWSPPECLDFEGQYKNSDQNLVRPRYPATILTVRVLKNSGFALAWCAVGLPRNEFVLAWSDIDRPINEFAPTWCNGFPIS